MIRDPGIGREHLLYPGIGGICPDRLDVQIFRDGDGWSRKGCYVLADAFVIKAWHCAYVQGEYGAVRHRAAVLASMQGGENTGASAKVRVLAPRLVVQQSIGCGQHGSEGACAHFRHGGVGFLSFGCQG